MKMIDVSVYQGDIDWKKVKADGIKGVIIRAGFGQGNVDKKFVQNIKGASAAGLHVGIYWFSYAYNVGMARKEAEICYSTIWPYRNMIDLPVFFDWEYDSMRYAKKNGVTPGKALITDMNLEFCNAIKGMGLQSGYYLNLDYSKNYIDESRLKAYKRWFAKYTKTRQTDCYLWQYSSKGSVSGISGNVDMNELIADVDFDENDEKPKDDVSESEEISMPTIKKGSKGKAVKIWQVIVGVEVDGVFGPDTDRATKVFQDDHGLYIDGIVGKNTWKKGLESVG